MKIARVLARGEVFYCEVFEGTLKRLLEAPYDGIEYTGIEYDEREAVFLPPCEPKKFVCVGKNYYEHAMEMKEGNPEEPLLFIKPDTCLNGPDGEVVYPAMSKRLDYEGELAVVIGKRATKVEKGRSGEFIFGYTCANDITARDIQKGDRQWTRGKGFDGFAPIGPWIETDIDASELKLETRLNGVTVQTGTTNMMTHDVDKLIHYITECITLNPGDVVLTGTPAGVGPMERGDIVEVEIEGIGILRNSIV